MTSSFLARWLAVAGVAVVSVPLVAGPVAADTQTRALQIVDWENDVPYTKRCSTAVITLYNPYRTSARGVEIHWKGDYNDTWRWLKGRKDLSWQYSAITVAPKSSRTFTRLVCASWRNNGAGGMSVKPIKANGYFS